MEQSTQQNNPLKQYFRQFKIYLALPSGTTYYTPDVLTFTEQGEVGVLPMTGKDELALKNPDALLNGEALNEVLSSCIPTLKQPKMLLANDIEALITAIRYATFNDTLETTLNCPKCKTENTFKLDLQYALDNMSFLEPEYVVNLESGLSVFVKPYSFAEMLKSLHSQFEQTKLVRAMESETIGDDQRVAILGKAFKTVAVAKFEVLSASIAKIVDESNNVNVTDRAYIQDFLQNIDKKSLDKISDLIDEINKIGIKKSFTAKCDKCSHEWENEIDFNPVNFS